MYDLQFVTQQFDAQSFVKFICAVHHSTGICILQPEQEKSYFFHTKNVARFLGFKVVFYRFLKVSVYKKTGHKITTMEEHAQPPLYQDPPQWEGEGTPLPTLLPSWPRSGHSHWTLSFCSFRSSLSLQSMVDVQHSGRLWQPTILYK